MSDLKQQFEAAAAASRQLTRRPDNQTMLRLYALYKQASAGDVAGSRPGAFDFVGGAKYDARAELKGTSPEDAMRKYIDLVNQLKA
jgi:acyl-CoA-binding protein